MSLPPELEELRDRALRVFPGGDLSTVLRARKAIVFSSATIDRAEAEAEAASSQVDAARARDALRKLMDPSGPEPNAEETRALEICIRFMRPAVVVERGRLGVDGGFKPTPSQREGIEHVLPGIAAICRATARPIERGCLATGFLVGPRALMTNVHVVQAIVGKDEQDRNRPLETLSAGQAVACFGLERDRPSFGPTIAIERLVARHPTLDVAIVELREECPFFLPLARERVAARGRRIAAVGHPLEDEERNPLFVQAVFDGVYGVKRVSPGEVLDARGDLVFHDCSTLGGNSGSALVDIESGAVLGVHASGEFAFRNEGVASAGIAREPALRDRVARWTP